MNKFTLQILLNPDNIRIYNCEKSQTKIMNMLSEFKYAVKIEPKFTTIDITGEHKFLYRCLKELSSYYALEII